MSETWIPVDPSWADSCASCVVCGHDVPWDNALIVPCSPNEDGDPLWPGIVHRTVCPVGSHDQ